MSPDGGMVAAAVSVLRWVMRVQGPDIKPGDTRLVRGGRGFPWSKQFAVHPTGDGRIQIVPIEIPKTGPEKKPPAPAKPTQRKRAKKG